MSKEESISVWCLPIDIYNPLCRNCIRRRSHQYNSHLNGTIVNLTVFTPKWNDHNQKWECSHMLQE